MLIKLAEYTDRYGQAKPSIETICAELEMSRATVYRSLSGLEGKCLIRRGDSGQKTTLYILFSGVEPRVSGLRNPSQYETGGLNMRPEGTSNPIDLTVPIDLYLQPSVVGAPGGPVKPKARKPKRRKSKVAQWVASFPEGRSTMRGFSAMHTSPGYLRELRNETPDPDHDANQLEETPVPMPAFEKDEPGPNRRRRKPNSRDHYEVADEGLAVIGKLDTPRVKPQPWYETKPVGNWLATDLFKYIAHHASQKAPDLREQIPVGRAKGEFAKWLSEGTSAATLKASIDGFFADSNNFLTTSGPQYTIWQRYRYWFIDNQVTYAKKSEAASPEAQRRQAEIHQQSFDVARQRLAALRAGRSAREAEGAQR